MYKQSIYCSAIAIALSMPAITQAGLSSGEEQGQAMCNDAMVQELKKMERPTIDTISIGETKTPTWKRKFSQNLSFIKDLKNSYVVIARNGANDQVLAEAVCVVSRDHEQIRSFRITKATYGEFSNNG